MMINCQQKNRNKYFIYILQIRILIISIDQELLYMTNFTWYFDNKIKILYSY